MKDNPEKLAQEYYEVKEKIRKLENKRQQLRNSLFSIFDEIQDDKIYANDIKVYRVNRPRITWNKKILERILMKKGLLYQVLSPDPKKIKDLINQGIISDNDLDQAKIIKDSWYTYAERLSQEKSSPSLHQQEKKFIYNYEEQNLNNGNLGSRNLIITDLSRMKEDRVCICGLDYKGSSVRPVLPNGVRARNMVDKNGELIIKPFALVKFELMKPLPRPPHIEDVRWDLSREPQFIRNLSLEERKELMENLAYDQAHNIFSADLIENRFIEKVCFRSIGTLKPQEIIEIKVEKNDGEYKYRMVFSDKDDETFNLPVNDLAFRQYFNKCFKYGFSYQYVADELLDKFEKYESFLRLGLTRKFRGVYWIQVTGAYTFPYYNEFK